MPLYAYRARTEIGGLVKGQVESDGVDDAAREIQDLGYVPVQIRRDVGSRKWFFPSRGIRVRADDLILFTRQFNTVVRTGVPLVRGLQTLRDQTERNGMRAVIAALLKDIQEGTSLGEAMKKFPAVFSPVYRNTVHAGETSGKLEEILARLAELLEYEQKVKEEIKAATRYPMMVIIVMALAFFVLVTFVIPKFTRIYLRFDMELPLPTRILIGMNEYIRGYWHVNLLLLVLAVWGIRRALRTEWGRRIWDRTKIRAPVLGKINFKGIISRFARILATLSSSGVPILEALDIVQSAVGNRVVGDKIGRVRKQVMEGTGLAVPMNREGGFPPLLVQMVAVGEETGALEEMLAEVSRHYESEIDYSLRRLTSAIEPILIIGLGAMMLVMALAVFMPLWNMVNIIH